MAKPPRETRPAIPLRRIARKHALQYLYQLDTSGAEHTPEALTQFWEQAGDMHDQLDAREWAKTRPVVEGYITGILTHRTTIDEAIQQQAHNWKLERMAVVDRNILRLAVYELYYCPDVPPVVVINEAVDLAKGFSAAESSAFVNGILDHIRLTAAAAAKRPAPDTTAP